MKIKTISNSLLLLMLTNLARAMDSMSDAQSIFLEKENTSYKLSTTSSNLFDQLGKFRDGICNATMKTIAEENYLRVWTISYYGREYALLDRAVNGTAWPLTEKCLHNFADHSRVLDETADGFWAVVSVAAGVLALYACVTAGKTLKRYCCYKEDKSNSRLFQPSTQPLSSLERGGREDTLLLPMKSSQPKH